MAPQASDQAHSLGGFQSKVRPTETRNIKTLTLDSLSSETQLRSRLKKWRVTKPSRQTRKKPRNDRRDISDDDGVQGVSPEQTSSVTPTIPLASPQQTARALSTTEVEWCIPYEGHMQQNSLAASANEGMLGHWASTLQPSPLQIQEGRPPMMQHDLNGTPNTSSSDPTNSTDHALIDTAPAIAHTYLNTGYPTASDAALPSLNPAPLTEGGHHRECQVLESVPQWYPEHFVTTSQIQWVPLYSCTGLDPPIVHPRHRDRTAQPPYLQNPHPIYSPQPSQYPTVPGQVPESFKSMNIWQDGAPVNYFPDAGAIYPIVDTQEKEERHLGGLSRTPVNNELTTPRAEQHPAICAPISNYPAQGLFPHISYV